MKKEFICPKCHKEFVTELSSKPTRIEDVVGQKCNSCGYQISNEDIKNSALKIAEEMIKKSLKGIKFK